MPEYLPEQMQQQDSKSHEMRILALETSGRRGSITLAKATGTACEIIESVELPQSQRTARSLVPEVGDLLKRCSWRPDDLGLVCVTTGPGSFTGLRIGVTAAKTIDHK